MDQTSICDLERTYPLLFIPKRCTRLETNCEVSDNVFIEVKIISPDTEGNDTCIYSGFCNIKLIDTYDVNVQSLPNEVYVNEVEDIEDQIPIYIANTDAQYNQSEEVWIDPSRSPFVYNRCDSLDAQTKYSVCHQTHTTNCITLEQHNTYITKNIYNCKEAVQYSMVEEDKKVTNIKKSESQTQHKSSAENIVYEDDELECGLFLSQLPEEIMIEKENKEKEERKFIDLSTDNRALKQLMSSDIQSVCKQRKTILFLGQNSKCGQTIQKIAYNDPLFECSGKSKEEKKERNLAVENNTKRRHKKYQCAKCSQIFNNISEFRKHMVDHSSRYAKQSISNENQNRSYVCPQCGKSLKTKDKFQKHCQGHGNPEVECKKCHKVYASKFTLRVHAKLHARDYPCNYCSKTFEDFETLSAHTSKRHCIFLCATCDYIAKSQTDLEEHLEIHDIVLSETEQVESPYEVVSEREINSPSPNYEDWKIEESTKSIENAVMEECKDDEMQEVTNDELAECMMSESFFFNDKRSKRLKKTCNVCLKTFNRVSDLKRHLIEHVVRRTLTKTPVSRNGKLRIRCEVCQVETFSKVDRYKAHLREHAKLTLYQCTFCNKSFSDSSNFSKHKKIHGTTFFQCDLCKRKFNSKQMLILHMEYHKKHAPLNCSFCKKQFHFESMLNKHVKSSHTKEVNARFRCRFCPKYYKTLKEKWDHEWTTHSARKMVADCLLCGAKFRKYSELKRHCHIKHEVEIPTAKKLLKEEQTNNVLTNLKSDTSE